ncbi:MAG: FecR family protein [Opitutaceae bacterium]
MQLTADRSVRRTAAEWLARRHGGFKPGEEFEFERWLAADPANRATFAGVESAWAAVNAPTAARQGERLRNGLAIYAGRQRRRRQRTWFVSAGVAAAAALVFAFVVPQMNPPPMPDTPATVALRPDKRTLPDGSVVELNAGAEIAVEFAPARRGVRLIRGEAMFEVARDITRPFVVSAGAVEVKAVGTAFAVRFDPKHVDVLVTEGRVAVNRVSPEPDHTSIPEPVYIEAGGRLALPANVPAPTAAQVEPVSPAQIATALAWRGKRIEFTDTPLAEAMALFNRQNQLQLSIENRANGARCINGIFWTDDPAGFARLLETSLGMTQSRQGGSIVLHDR